MDLTFRTSSLCLSIAVISFGVMLIILLLIADGYICFFPCCFNISIVCLILVSVRWVMILLQLYIRLQNIQAQGRKAQ